MLQEFVETVSIHYGSESLTRLYYVNSLVPGWWSASNNIAIIIKRHLLDEDYDPVL